MQLDINGDTVTALAAAEQLALEQGNDIDGDLVVFVGALGPPFDGQTNLLKVQIAGGLEGLTINE